MDKIHTTTHPMSSMLDPAKVDRLFPAAAAAAVTLWLWLLGTVYYVTPTDNWVVLEGMEREAPLLAAVVLVTSLAFFLLPFLKILRVRQRHNGSRPSGILAAAISTVCVAIGTNLMLAFLPTAVMIDPVMGGRIFLVRWCEWVPTAGLMTFMADVVDAKKEGGVHTARMHGLTQLVSCFCGMVFPFCPNFATWNLLQVVAMLTYLPIFPRVGMKRRLLAQESDKLHSGFLEKEVYDRRYFAYHLLNLCGIVWTCLVVMYYVHVLIYLYLPAGHWLRHQSSAMVVDTAFDVLAKSLYLRVIVEVHNNVFDSDLRAHRQLEELRRLMQVLWDSTTDTIVISVRNSEQTCTFLSPSFQSFVGGTPTVLDFGNRRPGFVLQTSSKAVSSTSSTTGPDEKGDETKANVQGTSCGDTEISHPEILDARYIDSRHIASSEALENLTIARIDVNSKEMKIASKFIQSCWNDLESRDGDSAAKITTEVSGTDNKGDIMPFQFTKTDGEVVSCEVKVSRAHKDNSGELSSSASFVAILRDVTERSKRLEAEQKAQAEALARQKDAQNANRFTRHEIKNGLLAGIELCDGLHRLMQEAHQTIPATTDGTARTNVAEQSEDSDRSPLGSKVTGTIHQIDRVLHEILDTVLAEAMARDVIHETYQVHRRRTDLVDLLRSSLSSDKQRFPLTVAQGEDLPDLLLDTQLFRYIHRNAISNAAKYGKSTGTISTHVHYDKNEELLEVEVVNEPGTGHERLVEMGQEACDDVFKPGRRLHSREEGDHHNLSSGDGGFIMQKCAKNMGGACSISFEPDKTVFRFHCHAAAIAAKDSPEGTIQFELPHNTCALGIDDSWIQRKLLVRIFANLGIQAKRKKVIGRNMAECDLTETVMIQLLDQDPEAKLLVLVDENLDFEADGNRTIISGSRMLEMVLNNLQPHKRDRVLVIVRSANDSAEDIAIYTSRAHGFLSKTYTNQEDVLDVLEPCWANKFGVKREMAQDLLELDFGDESESFSKDDLQRVVASVDSLVEGKASFREVPWSHLWSALHSLKGDLVVFDNEQLKDATLAITAMRDADEVPEDFDDQWASIRSTIMDAIDERL